MNRGFFCRVAMCLLTCLIMVSGRKVTQIKKAMTMPIAADDNTYEVLKVGNWWHRKGKLSDLSTASYEKLDEETKAGYILVQSSDDLGKEVRLVQPFMTLAICNHPTNLTLVCCRSPCTWVVAKSHCRQ